MNQLAYHYYAQRLLFLDEVWHTMGDVFKILPALLLKIKVCAVAECPTKQATS